LLSLFFFSFEIRIVVYVQLPFSFIIPWRRTGRWRFTCTHSLCRYGMYVLV